MNAPQNAVRGALERLGSSGIPVRDAEAREQQRERIVGAVNRQAARLQERRRGRRHRQWRLLLAAMLTGLVLVAGTVLRAFSPATLTPDVLLAEMAPGVGRVVAATGVPDWTAGRELSWGDRLTVPSRSRLTLLLQERVEATLTGPVEAALPRSGTAVASRLELHRGRGDFAVSPLPPGHTFAVVTPDARVLVHGTRFVVEVVERETATVTRVSVSEGSVGVFADGRQVLLRPGDEWSSREPSQAASPADAVPAEVGSVVGAASARSPAAVSPPATVGAGDEAGARSTLAIETREYMAAMAAKRRGDDAAALERLEGFLQRYPQSPLAQSARVERFRLLRSQGREDAAAEEARRYMAEHPDGFARGEARDMAIPSASSQSR